MATLFKPSRVIPIYKSGESSRVCAHCQKVVVLCTCSIGVPFMTVRMSRLYLANNSLYEFLLDIESIEASTEDDLDVEDPLCDKSHQHAEFISVDDFIIGHLPQELRDPTTYVWLRNCIPLVVRLIRSNVKATGQACLLPQEHHTSIFCDNVHCPYLELLGLNHRLYGGIGIITSKHVVENDDQASMTRIEFFYNSEANRNQVSDANRNRVIYELGASVHITNTKMDCTVFKCFVHFNEMITFVKFLDLRRNYTWLKIPPQIRFKAKKFAVVISHPHGISKKISFGKVIEQKVLIREGQNHENVLALQKIFNICERLGPPGIARFDIYFRLASKISDIDFPYNVAWYTTPTCRGSSGAPVYMGNTVLEYGKEINRAHTHRGADPSKGYNNCLT